MRDPSRKLIGGVCSGLAKYLNMDVNLVRILTVLISLFTGIPIVLYIIALFLLPEERPEQQPPYVNGPQHDAHGYTGQAYTAAADYQQPPAQPQTTYAQPTRPPADDVWGSAGAPWEQPQHAAPASASATSAASASASAPSDEQIWPQPPAADEPPAQELPAQDLQVPASAAEPTPYDTAPVEPAADQAENPEQNRDG